MSETIREVLTNKELFQTIVLESDEVPAYFDRLPKQDGITAMTTALMIKAMGGDVAAFTALSKFGFGEKVQMEVSDFYRASKIDIEVVPPPQLDDEESPANIGEEVHKALTQNNIEEGEKTDGQRDDSTVEEEHGIVESEEPQTDES